MDKEQYVTYKVAQLLKEKGFPQSTSICNVVYKPNGKMSFNAKSFINPHYFFKDCYIFAPTQQMAMRWFWEEKGLNINAIYGDYPSQKRSFWMPQIDSLDGCYGVDDGDFFREYDSREDCIEAALEYALRNLI